MSATSISGEGAGAAECGPGDNMGDSMGTALESGCEEPSGGCAIAKVGGTSDSLGTDVTAGGRAASIGARASVGGSRGVLLGANTADSFGA